ncbi:hypothetical protein Pelo_17594 [Pelomyxa schiedti]|nr:hypothetical protein Pelo_17594 [Pelomyxa schiedti]
MTTPAGLAAREGKRACASVCPCCSTPYNDPRLLPCLHGVNLSCIKVVPPATNTPTASTSTVPTSTTGSESGTATTNTTSTSSAPHEEPTEWAAVCPTLPPPTPQASNSFQKSAATTTDHHPKIICTECLFSGEHVGHTNHENLAVAEKRLRGSLEEVIETLTQRCANALNTKCNAEAQLSALQRQLNDCDKGMETEVQQLVKSILEVLKGCQINLRKLVTTKSRSLENVVTQSRNQFYVLSNNIVLGKRLCSLEGIKVGETTSSSFGPSSVKRPPMLDNNTSSFAFVNVFLQLQPTLQKAFVESSTQATSEHNDANVAPEIKEVMDTVHELTREKPGEVKYLRAKCAHLQKAVARLGTLVVGELLFDTPGDEHKVVDERLVFDTPGEHKVVVPPGVSVLSFVVVGAGGGAGCHDQGEGGGAGGGGGGCALVLGLAVAEGDAFVVVVGRGGAGGSWMGEQGRRGGDTTVALSGVTLACGGGGDGGKTHKTGGDYGQLGGLGGVGSVALPGTCSAARTGAHKGGRGGGACDGGGGGGGAAGAGGDGGAGKNAYYRHGECCDGGGVGAGSGGGSSQGPEVDVQSGNPGQHGGKGGQGGKRNAYTFSAGGGGGSWLAPGVGGQPGGSGADKKCGTPGGRYGGGAGGNDEGGADNCNEGTGGDGAALFILWR